ncbi:hypothetical protein LPJ66_001441 [Kickxella alabastrina]|uniref:Uncharacterized protein n=1 Tax=Kickxella alabastrina TaxID=61397 RepID=A0ACC1ITE1_9FUNG|nr:hypothetical protein LPJ66_001441 [Kickxella alabastrina]
MANAMLLHSGIPHCLWIFAIVHANWVLICLPKHDLGMSMTFKKLDSNSNIANMHPFSCLDWSEYPPELCSKFGECAQKCVYLGSKDGKALLYRMDTGHVLHISRARFDEAEFTFYSESAPSVPFYFHESDMADMPTLHGPICMAELFDEDDDLQLVQLQEEDKWRHVQEKHQRNSRIIQSNLHGSNNSNSESEFTDASFVTAHEEHNPSSTPQHTPVCHYSAIATSTSNSNSNSRNSTSTTELLNREPFSGYTLTLSSCSAQDTTSTSVNIHRHQPTNPSLLRLSSTASRVADPKTPMFSHCSAASPFST